MLKKLFITTLLMGACVIGFAQQPDAETKAAATELVKQKQTEMLEKISLRLKGGEEKVKFGESKNSQQFLFKENLIIEKLDTKSTELEKVFKKMYEKYVPSEFIYDGYEDTVKVGEIKPFYKNNKLQKDWVLVPVSFQTRTIAKDSVSDVRYNVTFTYKVKNEKVSFESSTVKKIDFLDSEKKEMLDAAKKAIVEWYANLSQTLDKQYSEQSITEIQPIEIKADDIKANLPNNKNFTITVDKNIEINIDPYQFIKDSEMHLYTNPSASLTITPTFNITVDDSFKKARVSSVEYSVDTIEPTTNDKKINQLVAAQSAIEKLAKELSSYVSSKDEELKSNIQSMFNAKSTVQVSYLLKNGKEKINNRPADKYLSLLKGSSLNFIDYTIEFPDPSNLNTLVFVINQDFKSKTYSDYTQKKIYLTYNKETETYSIDKIEVVPNSTKIQ